MARRLPPLNALRAFEASGRHASFAKAANELGVTPAAISHQVRQLEAYLGVVLFRRLTRRVLLTEAGQAALPHLTDGFDRLARGAAALRAAEETGVLTVSAAPSFAGRWLVPRIERFTSAQPNIDLRVSAGTALVDFHADQVDVAIRYGRGRYPGLKVDKLFAEAIGPLCGPALLGGPKALRAPADLAHHTLLHDDSTLIIGSDPDWRMWLAAAGVEGVDPSRGPRFGRTEDALQAACDGLGVVLGRLSLAARDIAAGRLARPFALSLPAEFAYYLVRPDTGEERPKVAAFRDWVLAEVAADEARTPAP